MTKYNAEGIEGIVNIAQDLYCKTPESLAALKEHLIDVGYDIQDLRKEEGRPSADVQEKNGWNLWFAKPSKKLVETKAECGSCKTLLDKDAVWRHGSQCSKCHEFTAIKYSRRGLVSFSITDDDRSMYNLTLIIHSYDKDKKQLHFYMNPKQCRNPFPIRVSRLSPSIEESYKNLASDIKKFPGHFKVQTIDGIKVVSVNNDADSHDIQSPGINPIEISGELQNYNIVDVFKGKRYDSWGNLPIPDSISIHEAWHWAPLKPGPDLYKKILSAARQVSRKDYYYQDGRDAFFDLQIGWILTFIKHFTTLDAERIAPLMCKDLSGPGFIDNLAKLTGNNEHIQTEPNIGNAMVFFGKVLKNEPVNQNEIDEAVKGAGLDDPNNTLGRILGDDFVKDVFEAVDGPTPFSETRSTKNKNKRRF